MVQICGANKSLVVCRIKIIIDKGSFPALYTLIGFRGLFISPVALRRVKVSPGGDQFESTVDREK